ncbi:pyridoxal 5'-phosphate synthase glutaminase subunit PdxT [Agrococcus casei]|uniref:pyridoxal 5'-phosphate synthase glutaminase subunit PdxT n=1 Tax=Agrococcus casei TaxID=343512 RepID=UPI003F91222B
MTAGAHPTRRIGVLALQGAVSEHASMLSALGAEPVLVRRPEQLDGLDALVVPGGESSAVARMAARVDLLPAVRGCIDAGMPVLGTCAGLILLAERVVDAGALDGFDRIGGLDVTVRRNGYGGQLASFEADVELDTASMHVAFIRAPIIEHVGSDARVLATHESRPVAVQQARVLAAAFHPEITGVDRLHRMLLSLID